MIFLILNRRIFKAFLNELIDDLERTGTGKIIWVFVYIHVYVKSAFHVIVVLDMISFFVTNHRQ